MCLFCVLIWIKQIGGGLSQETNATQQITLSSWSVANQQKQTLQSIPLDHPANLPRKTGDYHFPPPLSHMPSHLTGRLWWMSEHPLLVLGVLTGSAWHVRSRWGPRASDPLGSDEDACMRGKELGEPVLLLGAQPVHLYLPLTSGGLSQLLCHQGRGAATGNKYFKQTAVKVIQRMISFHSIVIGLPVRSVTRCLSIISETLNRKHWLANGQSCFRSDRGSVKGLPRGVCSCSYCVFLTGWDCRRWIKEERSEPWYRGPFYSCPLGSEGAGGILF